MEIINSLPFQVATIPGKMSFPKYSLSLVVKGTFKLVPGGNASTATDQLFPTGEEPHENDEEGAGSAYYESDFAHFKPRADLLLVGKCHTPSKKPVPACRVKFQVGNKSKSLAVIGNRYWKGLMRTISSPELFTEMPLRYENSYGGEGFKKNPVGKGYKKELDANGSKIWPLPNIEDPRNLITSSFNEPGSAGFAPLGKMWEHRFSKTGTYKGRWITERWPWFPKDFDWGHFNAAPPDMQVDGYIKGDEALYFENLHPVHSQYHSQLPGLRVRCFLNELDLKSDHPPLFREVSMNLDTLWVDMETENLVLVWRGVANVRSEEYEEVEHLFIVSEKLDEKSESLDYYKDLFNKKKTEEDGEEDFNAKPTEPVPTEDTTEVDAELAKAEKQLNSSLVAAGIDPDNPPTPSKEDKEKEAQILKEHGFEVEVEKPPLTRKILQERIARGEGFTLEDLRGLDLSALKLTGVNFQEAILTDVCLRKSDLSKANLNGANLSGVDLSDAKLQGATLQDADLAHANLTGANLSDAVLDSAIFEKTTLENAVLDRVTATGTNFSEANLTEASLKEASLVGADFSKSILNRSDFRGANLKEASVEGAIGNQVNMSETDLTELRASEECNFSQGSFQNANGKESIWEKANLSMADFSFSKMEGADFSSANLEGANLSAADMKFSRFTKANLKEAKCVQMNLFQGSFEKANLTRADLRGSSFYEVEFLDAILEETKLASANLKMTKLSKN